MNEEQLRALESEPVRVMLRIVSSLASLFIVLVGAAAIANALSYGESSRVTDLAEAQPGQLVIIEGATLDCARRMHTKRLGGVARATCGERTFLYAGLEFECGNPSDLGRSRTFQGVVQALASDDLASLEQQGLQGRETSALPVLNGKLGPRQLWPAMAMFALGCLGATMPLHFLRRDTWARMAAKRRRREEGA